MGCWCGQIKLPVHLSSNCVGKVSKIKLLCLGVVTGKLGLGALSGGSLGLRGGGGGKQVVFLSDFGV